MKDSIIRFFLLFNILVGLALGDYWQQWVEYDMHVTLNADAKVLTANSDLLYVNHSPDTLDQMLMQLYHNAFNAGTIAEQVWIDYGEPFDLDKGWTGISIQKASTDSILLEHLIRDDTILDIALNQPLPPGDTLRFSLAWTSKIHPHIDRSGWKGQQFDFAQWYPKFVVYDENGWHDDPFGDWGEFYGEVGNLTVHLDVPEEQIVCATGVVIEGDPGWNDVSVDTSRNWEEWVAEFREDRGTNLAKLDSSDRRQVSFFAENVHDFAWLCSPDFVYEHGQWNDIDIHVLFTTQVGASWTKDVVQWGVNSIQWLSEKFGMYSWPQMTIVKALLTGGMEYPMLVMDVSDSESLTAHEIGHNWFFGILGNDELDDPWLDEGFTTFQARWYMEHHYPDNGYDLTRDNITRFESENLPRQMYQEADLKPVIRYQLSPSNEPIATHSFDFKGYGSYRDNVYSKSSIMLDMLKNYLGEERFLMGMRLYYSRWALKHVNEDRFIKAMEDGSGEELDWFFDQWLHTTHYVDYKLSSWQVEEHDQDHFTTRINIDNRGGMFVPITATIFGENGETATATPLAWRHRSNASIEVASTFKPVRVYLDAENHFFDVDRRDNDSQKKRAWRYDFKDWDEYPDDRNLYLWKPQLGYSDSAGTGLGIQVKQVYRNTGHFIQVNLDENFRSNNPDIGLSFQHKQVGLPMAATWSGTAKTWRSMTYVALSSELNWARQFWVNPIHYLTLRVELTDARQSDVPIQDQHSFTRLGVQYELQDDLMGGDYGFSVSAYASPAGLGTLGADFSQLSLMSRWQKYFKYIHFNNRTNLLTNYSATPDLVKSRPASQNLQRVYLDRAASSLHNIGSDDMFGKRYYLRGGGLMRAYSDSLDLPTNFIWSNNLDLTVRPLAYVPDLLDFGVFLDFGQVSDNARDWKSIGDLGFALTYKPAWERNSWLATILRPFKLKIELSIARYEDKKWVNNMANNPWVFSISN